MDDPPPTLSSRLDALFAIPPPLRALFDAVPLLTYAPNPLPTRSPPPTALPTLHLFLPPSTSTTTHASNTPSPNPTCLTHQTLLRLARLPVALAPSTNHASPTGALPFLLPPTASPLLPATLLPIPPAQFAAYTTRLGHAPPAPLPADPRAPAYAALIDAALRPAWLHALYLAPANAPLAARLYVDPATRSRPVRATLAAGLRRAALDQLGQGGAIDVDDVYARAAAALEAFAILLGDADGKGDGNGEGEADGKGKQEWLFGGDDKGEPTMLDARLFAYTHLLLDEGMGWKDRRLVRAVERWGALVAHRERILERYWGEEEV